MQDLHSKLRGGAVCRLKIVCRSSVTLVVNARKDVNMFRHFLFLGVGLLAICRCSALLAEDQQEWQAAELKKLGGRWTTVREQKVEQDKIQRTRVDLEFADGELRVFLFDGKNAQFWHGGLKVIGVEMIDGKWWKPQLKLSNADVYYDFVGEKLILVGRVLPRPWEGFQLSGEYVRAKKPE
jgi:hypothetical protein